MKPRVDPASLVPSGLLNPVVDFFHPRRVILFGSRARGDAREGSDIDLLVIVDDDTPLEKLTLKAGYQARRSWPEPADVIPCRESVFHERCHVTGTLSHAALRDGIVVYER